MKKLQKFMACLLVCCLLAGLTTACAAGSSPAGSEPVSEQNDGPMILNKDGSYGGTLSEADYGPGAPLNGQYDVADSAYYTVNNDYYNMPSTEERLVIPKFATYQQTMRDSSGLACLLMILNHAGQDVQNTYSELALVERYEKVNGTKVYGNGTTAEGLINLIDDLGLDWKATTQSNPSFTKETTKQLLWESLKDGKFVLVRYQSPVGFGWKVVVGYDTLGEVTSTVTEELLDTLGDDVILFAEPFDAADHRQDGYATERMLDFYMWWMQMDITGEAADEYSFVVINTKQPVTYDLQPVDESPKQATPEKHLPLNPDGTYGGTRDEASYGKISSGRGWWEHVDANYYKIDDFYNMGSEGSRVLLSNYTVLQQTMASSCGLCALGSVMKYYGLETDWYELEMQTLEAYEQLTGKVVRGKGCGVQGLLQTANQFGFEGEASSTPSGTLPPYATYAEYMQFLRGNLEEGRPVVVSHNLGSGHYLTVIGLDDMGTEHIYDDVIIAADSSDYWDGYQDGYDTYSAFKFFSQHTNGSHSLLQSHLVLNKPN